MNVLIACEYSGIVATYEAAESALLDELLKMEEKICIK
jgi:hypothetical protein